MVMVPGPEFASPPETDQVTLAAPPPERVAENCSKAAPEELVVLQPVQFVSMAAVPGEMEKAALDEPPDGAPAQPASANSAGSAAIASVRASQWRSERAFDTGLPERVGRFRSTDGSDVFWLNSSGAFLAVALACDLFYAQLPASVAPNLLKTGICSRSREAMPS